MNLRAVDRTVTHPYWEWSLATTKGLPKAYTERSYTGGDGRRYANPLLRYGYECPVRSHGTTTRSPGGLAQLQQLGAMARASLNSTTFNTFQNSVENAYDGLHGWVGGSMGLISFAAYDPIFYAHHANIDRLWAAWQARWGNSTMPANELDLPLVPWPVRGRDVLSTKNQLCYRYVRGTVITRRPAMTAAVMKALAKEGPRPLAMSFPASKVGEGFQTAELQLRGLQFPTASYEVRVFVNDPGANADTRVADNDKYAGSIYIFGHGECYGASGHCDPVEHEPGDTREDHHLLPVDRSIDLTGALQAAGDVKGGMQVTLVVCDTAGKLVDHSVLSYENVALLARD